MSVQVSYKKQVILGIMFLLVILSGIEIISRVVLDQRDSCNQSLPMSGLYQYLSVSELKKICQDYKSIIQYPLPTVHFEPNQKTDTVTTNSHGFRGEEFDKEKTSDKEYRIFMVGGSTMFGIYATSDNTTIPGYLQEFYDGFSTDRDIRVINAGVNGHSSFDETHLIKNKIVSLQPDLVIVYDGWNDLGGPMRTEYKKLGEMEYLEQYSIVIRKYYKTIDFYEFVQRVWEKQIGEKKLERDNSMMEQKPILWESRWKEICELGEKENFDVIITLQPLLGGGEKALTDWELRNVKELSHLNPISSYEPMKNKLNALQSSCAGTEDLTNIFDGQTDLIYFDVGHMGDKGNKIIAQKMFDISSSFILNKHL